MDWVRQNSYIGSVLSFYLNAYFCKHVSIINWTEGRRLNTGCPDILLGTAILKFSFHLLLFLNWETEQI